MKKPNFFIIGAPKCGTTSLAAWLAEHPNIYMSPVKEPFFFSTDLTLLPISRYRRTHISTLEEYENLFKDCKSHHVAVGEASTNYLYSSVAVPNILSYSDDPKFIVMIRNPIEMAPAVHMQKVFQGIEPERDFTKAWYLQFERAKGRKLPRGVPARFLMYKDWCSLGSQLERLYEWVPAQKSTVILLDDLRANPRHVWLKVLDFLGVPDDGRLHFPRLNPARQSRSWALHKLILRAYTLRNLLGIPRGALGPFKILSVVDRFNWRPKSRPPIPPDVYRELVSSFADEVKKLERLLNRDLSHWLVPCEGDKNAQF